MHENYHDGDWFVKDVSEELDTFGALSLNVYSEEYEEEVELASVVVDDIDFEERLTTFNIIAKANDMYKILEELYETTNDIKLKERIHKLLEKNMIPKNYIY